MTHWFDQLAHPHTRRTALKAGALAGAVLVMPTNRLPAAYASPTEPCFKPCREIAKDKWSTASEACLPSTPVDVGRSYLSLLFGPGATVFLFLQLAPDFACLNRRDMQYVDDALTCKQAQCGDPGLYPGGNAPVAVCSDPGYVACGPKPSDCCNGANAECCGCNNGTLVCCRIGANCSCCGSGG